MSVLWRSWLTVCALVATVLAILGALATLQYNTILSHLIQDRLAVLAQTSHASFASALSLGLPLSGVRNAQAILERARQTDPDILAVHVFEGTGIILHSTDAGHPSSVRGEVLFAQSAATSDQWHTQTDQHLLIGGRLRDGLSRPVGGLVVVYPKTELSTSVRAMVARLVVSGAAVLLLAALLAVPLLRFGLRDLVRVFHGIESAFDSAERREWRRAAQGSDALPQPVRGIGIDTGEIWQMLNDADASYAAVGAALAALEREPPAGADRAPARDPGA